MSEYLSSKQWGQIIAKAWKDPEFKTLLESDPTAAIHQFASENGGHCGDLMSVPERPANLSDEQVNKIANGDEHLQMMFYCC